MQDSHYSAEAAIAIRAAKTAIQALELKEISPKVVGSELELTQACAQATQDGASLVILKSFEHSLRSYRPITCWLLMTVISTENSVASAQTFMIDAVKLNSKFSETVGLITSTPHILKVVETAELVEKLETEFGCRVKTVVLEEERIETSDCHSTVLIKQDYRLRPASLPQMQIFA